MTRGAHLGNRDLNRTGWDRPERRRAHVPARQMRTSYAPLAAAVGGLLILSALVVAWVIFVPGNPTRSRVPPDKWPQPPVVEPVTLMPIQPDVALKVNESRPFDVSGPIASAPRFRFVGSEASRARATACLAAAAWYEAGDDVLGDQSVMQVVLNRARHPAFPRTVCGVVFQGSERATGCQFTFTCDGSMTRRKPSAAAWARALALASSMLNGLVDPRVGVASHYHTNWVVPYWAPSLAKLAQVRTHIFYSWRGRWGTVKALAGSNAGDEPVVARLAGLSSAHAAALDTAVSPALVAETSPPAGEGSVATGVGDRALRGAIVRADEGQNGRFFIQVDAGTFAGNHALAALTLCKGRSSCRVYGWRDAPRMGAALPLSDGQRDALTFFYARDEGRGDQALWNCAQVPRNNKAQCLPLDPGERAALTG